MTDLSPCCACGCYASGGNQINNIVFLSKRLPLYLNSQGWGDPNHGLDKNGAIAVLCDRCLMEDMRPTKYIHGGLNAAEDGSLSCTTERREIKDLADSKERKDYLMKWIENGAKVSAEVNFHVS